MSSTWRRLGTDWAIVLIPAILASIYGWAVFASTFVLPGRIGFNYNAPGTDWMVMYGASVSSLSGHLPLIFDGERFTAYLNAAFSSHLTQPLAFRPWVYPPSFLLVIAPLSGLGFSGSYAAFQFISAALLAAALLYRPDRPATAPWIVFAALISPAASINAVDGQCGFLVGALLIGAVRLIPTRPLLAGVLLGFLTFKPQFGLLAPIALIALRQGRCALSAVLTTLALFAASAAAFGMEAWVVWFQTTVQGYLGGDPKWVQYGRIWGNSVYACAVLLGASAKLASMLQTVSILGSAAVTYVTFRRPLPLDLKLAVLLAATLLAAPHSASYDDALLVVAAGLWLSNVRQPLALWRGVLALSLWFAALLAPPMLSYPGRFTPLLLCLFITIVLTRGSKDAVADGSRVSWPGPGDRPTLLPAA